MGIGLASPHGPKDEAKMLDDGTLTCTCGWTYSPDPEFAEGVLARHNMERNYEDD